MIVTSRRIEAYGRSRVPLYIQVASVMRGRVRSGHWSPGDKIPSLETLEREFAVARVTVRQAIDILREEGLLDAQQGRGTFVAGTVSARHELRLGTTWDGLIEMARDNVFRTVRKMEGAAPPRLEATEGHAAPDYVRLASLQYRSGEPYSIVDLHLARIVYEREPDRFMSEPALPLIAALPDVRLGDARQTLVIESADIGTAERLKIAVGAPTIQSHCVVVDASGIAIYVADVIYRSDRMKLQIDLLASPDAKSRDDA
jgi:GntR family transcriptional regulator